MSVIPKPLFDTLEQVCDLYKRCQVENQEQVIKEWLTVCLSSSKATLSDEIANISNN